MKSIVHVQDKELNQPFGQKSTFIKREDVKWSFDYWQIPFLLNLAKLFGFEIIHGSTVYSESMTAWPFCIGPHWTELCNKNSSNTTQKTIGKAKMPNERVSKGEVFRGFNAFCNLLFFVETITNYSYASRKISSWLVYRLVNLRILIKNVLDWIQPLKSYQKHTTLLLWLGEETSQCMFKSNRIFFENLVINCRRAKQLCGVMQHK